MIQEFYKNYHIISKTFFDERDFKLIDQISDFTKQKDIKTLLDVGCGYGFVTNNIQNKNVTKYGFDISKDLIDIAEKNKKENTYFECCDFSDAETSKKYDFVINTRTSFGNFEENEKNITMLKNMLEKTEKYFLLDYVNTDKIKKSFKPVFEIQKDCFKLVRKSHIKNDYLYQEWNFLENDSLIQKINLGVQLYNESFFVDNILKYASKAEIQIFGNYNFDKFDSQSDRMIFLVKM